MHAKPSIASFTNDAIRGDARKDVRSVWWRHAGDAAADFGFSASAYTPLSAMVRNRGSASLNWYMLCRESPRISICAGPSPVPASRSNLSTNRWSKGVMSCASSTTRQSKEMAERGGASSSTSRRNVSSSRQPGT